VRNVQGQGLGRVLCLRRLAANRQESMYGARIDWLPITDRPARTGTWREAPRVAREARAS
jgi:hypothetical protein